ncbi:hypothetical protein IMG5_196470 [Ichthyophthirius multifiliis]|uniref:Uncharacterized protein n=1 Tax=Ichthyophthirius multifiliis TaxID=5932 RepID=G0R553_ICHMU|nr:hypothetical protein IMG5_196470 [Ichthyophthirius multifiliis]EGR27377.1 hypothetical protein IMG5_196470 [Ichthyophthirius multifiliis]|eukprot:XP_004024261.1 hypothetical protein IMG5_196470 [Ichthyophthirius multifiliis]
MNKEGIQNPEYETKSIQQEQKILKSDQIVINYSTFNDFNLNEDLLRSIKEAGLITPFEVQQKCIPKAIFGTDILCQAKAGTGKTAVFVISVLNQLSDNSPPFSCLVLCHTRESAYYIKNEFKRLGKFTIFKTETVFGGVQEKIDAVKLKNEQPHILVTTPGKFQSLLKQKELIKTINVKHFIVDECDKVMECLKMRKVVKKIFMQLPLQKQVMMFSGTICIENKYIQVIIEDNYKQELVGLDQYYLKVDEKLKISMLIQFLTQFSFNQVIIFVNKFERAECVSKYLLEKQKIESQVICRTFELDKRNQIYTEFIQGKKRVLVATDLFARSSYIERIKLVINFDMPEKYDDYMHRVGKASTQQTKGMIISFVSTKEDDYVLKDIQNSFQTKISEYNLPNIAI